VRTVPQPSLERTLLTQTFSSELYGYQESEITVLMDGDDCILPTEENIVSVNDRYHCPECGR
jgi:hypothetical protein